MRKPLFWAEEIEDCPEDPQNIKNCDIILMSGIQREQPFAWSHLIWIMSQTSGIAIVIRWWFQIFFIFTPKIGEDFQFD